MRMLDGANAAATYSLDGYLIFVRDRVLLAQRFDERTRQLVGDPRPIAGNVSPGAVTAEGCSRSVAARRRRDSSGSIAPAGRSGS
jgi:hypothetical protein